MHIVLTKIKGISDYSKQKPSSEVFTMPSVVEPVHNLSIEEILRDYTRGIVHSSLSGAYDEGEDIQPVERIDDLSDFLPNRTPNRRATEKVPKGDESYSSENVQHPEDEEPEVTSSAAPAEGD